MPFKSPFGALKEIRDNIDLARSFVAGLSFDSFRIDQRTVYAVTRCLEIVSEASRKLRDELKARHRDIPWANIAAAGNVYRHDYEEVLDEIVWRTVELGLEPLRRGVEQELARLEKD